MINDIEFVVPGWNNPQTQQKLLLEMRNYAIAMGFKPEELDVRDRRILLMVYKAMKFDKSTLRRNGK